MRRATVFLVGLVLCGSVLSSPARASSTTSSIVVLRDGTDPDRNAFVHHITPTERYRNVFPGYAADLTSAQRSELEHDSAVSFVTSDTRFKLADATPTPLSPAPPAQITVRAVRRVGGDTSSTVSGDGSGDVPVNVAVIDSGVDRNHPDLNVVGGYNCLTPPRGATRWKWRRRWGDHNGHGTIVAGVIGALDNTIGVVGIAPGARIFSYRVLHHDGTATAREVICGIERAIATRFDADMTNDIAVANLSLGGGGSDDGNCGRTRRDPLHMAICRAVKAGITVVVGAGNDSVDVSHDRPAAYNEALTVLGMADSDGSPGGVGGANPCDATEPDDVYASFSNFAGKVPSDVDHVVAASAVCVSSTYPVHLAPDFPYAVDSGTSYAAPAVTGTVALCIYSGPCAALTPPQIVAKIVDDAKTYNEANTTYGFDGDPLRPVAGKYFGYLIHAGSY